MFKINIQSRVPQTTTRGLPKLKLGKGHNIVLIMMSCIGIVIIMIAFFGAGFMMTIGGYSGGWECRTRLDSIYIGSQNKWFDAETAPFGDIPFGPKVVQFDPTSSIDYEFNWQWTQEPDIYVNVDDPIHASEDANHELRTDAAGKVISTPEDEPVRVISKQRDESSYFYIHHVYATVVTVKTQSDQYDVNWLYQSLLETKGEEGIALVFTIRFEFIIEPWDILGDTVTEGNTTYVITEAFAGVMSASIESVEAGFNDRTMQTRLEEKGSADVLTTVTTGFDIIKPVEHSSANMYVIDGVETNINYVPSDPSTIEGVPNRVLIDVSGTLWPGAAQPLFALASPYDMFMQFTVRIDTLSAAGFTPVVGTDPLVDPPDDIVVGPVPFYYPLAYMLGQLWGAYWWVVVLVVVIVFIILALIIMTRVRALVRK